MPALQIAATHCVCLPSIVLMSCRTAVDSYMKARDPAGPFLAGLRNRIALSQQDSIMQGTRYNVPLLNALVFYVGIEVSSRLLQRHSLCSASAACLQTSCPMQPGQVGSKLERILKHFINFKKAANSYWLA